MMSTVIVKIQPLLTYWSDPALAKLLRQDLKGWLDPRLSDKPVLRRARFERFVSGVRPARSISRVRTGQGAECQHGSAPFSNGARLAHGSLQARQGARCRNASRRPLGGKCLTIGAPHL